MVNAKTAPYIVYFIVAAVILLALAAIIASRWSAASAEYTTCTQTEDEHNFDVKATITGPDWGELPLVTFVQDIRVSGEDLHIISTKEGVPGIREHIVKDGEFYTKPPGETWQKPPSDIYGIPWVWSLVNTRPHYLKTDPQYILCDKEGTNKARIGHYKERKVFGPEFITGDGSGMDPEELAKVPDTEVTWEYWVGNDGKIAKVKQTYDIVGGEDWEMRQTTAEISGVGEPNTITAPTLGSS